MRALGIGWWRSSMMLCKLTVQAFLSCLAARASPLGPIVAGLGSLSEAEVLDAIDRGRHCGGRSGAFWVLDPIDGTKGFCAKMQYAIALALVQDGEARPQRGRHVLCLHMAGCFIRHEPRFQVVAGLLGCPNLPLEGPLPSNSADALAVAASASGGSLLTAVRGCGAFMARH